MYSIHSVGFVRASKVCVLGFTLLTTTVFRLLVVLACMTVLNRPVATNETPLSHQLGNIIGLALLEKLGLSMGVGEFSFQTKFDYFWSDTPTKALFLDST
jgi:hypothetical protein